MDETCVIEGVNLCKHYGAVVALDEVNLAVARGEIVALVGDNGAGKSTLVKVLAGAVAPDSGHVAIGGQRRRLATPGDARKLGVEVIWQDLALSRQLDVSSNLFLGRELVRGIGPRTILPLRKTVMQVEARSRLQSLGADLNRLVDVPVGRLSGGQQQILAVAKGAGWAARCLLMDEPTAALGVKQTSLVLTLIRRLADAGVGIVLITHSIPEMLPVVDRIVVMRLGRIVADRAAADMSVASIVETMVG